MINWASLKLMFHFEKYKYVCTYVFMCSYIYNLTKKLCWKFWKKCLPLTDGNNDEKESILKLENYL